MPRSFACSPVLARIGLAVVASLVGTSFAACGAGGGTGTGAGGNGAGQGEGGSTSTGTAQGGAASTTSSGTTTTTGAGGAGGGNTACSSDADCANAPGGDVCDTMTGQCVGCVPGDATCQKGEYCNPATQHCEAGCDAQDDCDAPLVCDSMKHACVGCTGDADCAAGSICAAGTCVPGCNPQHDCQLGDTCCGTQCFDVQTATTNCGACGNACAGGANADAVCSGGQCGIVCKGAYADCNGDPADGCEHNTIQDGACACQPGATQPCYDGPPGTSGVGPCHAGVQTCDANGTSWGACAGQVIPTQEVCANNIDDDCNGPVDDIADQDGDGWTKCNGDCCDSLLDGCNSPALVNPGAFDVAGNQLDDDCNGQIDDGGATCDGALVSNSSNALDYAKAIDLCATTVENPPLAQKKWGVIAANLYRANGAGTPAANSRSIRKGFGSNVSPLRGTSFAVLSTGVAAAKTAPNNTSPAYAKFQGGQAMGTSSGAPADWLAAHGGAFPNSPGCPAPQGGTTANDPVMLKIRVRAPTNAKSFDVSSFFYSSEYPEWVCSPYNDFFLTLLDSTFVPGPGESSNPSDKNLAFYDPAPPGGTVYPVGVNLAFGNTGLFQVCKNGQTGCAGGSVVGTTNTCLSTAQLTGTGFDDANPPPQFADDPGYCGANNLAGGGTGWLTTSGNVKPGETIELRFVIWDTGDEWYDSVVLLDSFQWSLDAAQPGTHN